VGYNDSCGVRHTGQHKSQESKYYYVVCPCRHQRGMKRSLPLSVRISWWLDPQLGSETYVAAKEKGERAYEHQLDALKHDE
jgi:hypothetical protein